MSEHRAMLRRWRGRVTHLADLLGVDAATVWRWRNGRSTPSSPGVVRMIEWINRMSDTELRDLEGHVKRYEWAAALALIATTGGTR